MTPTKLKIFISHASADTDVAGALSAWIRTTFLGAVDVFVSSDVHSITPGDDWRATIEDSLRQADVALVICTETSLSRPWLGFEAGAAWMRGARVVPLCYHGLTIDSLPQPFAIRQGLDLGNSPHVDALLSLIASAAGFDPSAIERKQLPLPDRRAATGDLSSLDIRAFAEIAWLGSRGLMSSDTFKHAQPAMAFHIENHGLQAVYLEGGVDILLTENRGKMMIRDFDGVPTYRRDLLPGQSERVFLRLNDVRPEEFSAWDSAFFTDQIGRRFFVTAANLAKAVADYTRWWQTQNGGPEQSRPAV